MTMAQKVKNYQGEIMNGYWCDSCENILTSHSDVDFVLVNESEAQSIYYDGGYYQTVREEDSKSREGWICSEGCWHVDETPDYEEIWKCGECETLYTDREEAADCC